MNYSQHIKVAIKCTTVVVVWALLSLPTVFYLYNRTTTIKLGPVAAGCTNYNKATCLQVLYQTQNCGVSCNDSSIAIEADVDLEANENTAQLIKNGLTVLGASQTCISYMIPFMCLYLFPLCGANATVSREQCLLISTDVCKDEWQVALSIPTLKDQIPNCESLSSISGNEMPVSLFYNATTTKIMVNCSDQFILTNGTCRPKCDTLKLYSDGISDGDFVIQCMAAFAAVVCGVLLIITSYARRKKMFVFPAIIIPYMAIPSVVFALFILISILVDRKTLYCSSEYLTEALEEPTTYCSVIGSVYVYSTIQLGIFWLCHVSFIFMKTQFPVYSRGLDRSKTLHLTVVLLAVLLPCIPVIAAFSTGGYVTSIYPQLVCLIKNPDAAYFSFAFMMSVITAIGVPLLIITFSTAIKHNFLKRRNSNAAAFLPTAEIRILILLCYFILLVSMITAGTTIVAQNGEQLYIAFLDYFACEATGTSSKCDAAKEAFQPLTTPGIWVTVHILLGAFPGVHLLYVVDVGEVTKKCFYCIKDKISVSASNTTKESI